tara:strand:- start:441 stop:623 length:183 start_codon:yes stop_codon:yes gene_type:complete
MINPLTHVKNVRTVYDRFKQKSIKEVQVQFTDEDPAWIPYETLISMMSYTIEKEYTDYAD